jgi:signal peptidase I
MTESQAPPAEIRRGPEPPRSRSTWLVVWGGGMLALLVVLLRLFAYAPFNIPSGSMKPTLLIGDYIVVETYAYGWSRYSLPFGFPRFAGRRFYHSPKRGDVAVFRQPANPGVEFIKRVVGLPGDTVQVIQGNVFVNGEPARHESLANFLDSDPGVSPTVLERYLETLPEGPSYEVLLRPRRDEAAHTLCTDPKLSSNDVENTCPFLVPEDHFFVLGDNRDNSADSRVRNSGVGMVPAENLVGRVSLILFSLSEGRLSRLWQSVR